MGGIRQIQSEFINWKFMELACLLGADPRMWLPEQLARLPNAVRIKNQKLQKTSLFRPVMNIENLSKAEEELIAER